MLKNKTGNLKRQEPELTRTERFIARCPAERGVSSRFSARPEILKAMRTGYCDKSIVALTEPKGCVP